MMPLIPAVDPEQTRPATCDCGRTFTQHRISEDYMDALATHRKGAAVAIASAVPDLWVPVYCPGCESKQLGLEARRAAMRVESSADFWEPAA